MGLVTSERVWLKHDEFRFGSLTGGQIFLPTTTSNVITTGDKSELQHKVTSKIDSAVFGTQVFQCYSNDRVTFNYFNTNLNLALSLTNIPTLFTPESDDFLTFVWVAPTSTMEEIAITGLSAFNDFTAENLAKKYSLIESSERNFIIPYQFLSRLASSEYSLGIWKRFFCNCSVANSVIEANLSFKIGFD